MVIAAGAYGVYLLVPAPLPNFTSEDLLGAYAGMVRSDGENEVSLLDRSKVAPSPLAVLPVSCTVLFEQTEGNMFPMAAVDGVSTYWLNEGSASISLSTFRYPDAPTAEREFETMAKVLAPCADVVVNDRTMQLRPEAVNDGKGAPAQIAYLAAAPGDRGRFATQVFQLSNTVTWQYRYDYGRGPYDPSASKQLTDSLVVQLDAVRSMHR